MNYLCESCKLYKAVNNPYIEGCGDYYEGQPVDILFVGESPSLSEDKQGKYLIDERGNFLYKSIITPHVYTTYFVTGSVKCCTLDKKGKYRAPKPTETKCCKAFTFRLIDKLKPKVIVALGNSAFKQLVNVNVNMTVARGKVYYHPYLDIPIIPTWSPTDYLKNKETLYVKHMVADVKTAMDQLDKPKARKIAKSPKTLRNDVDIINYLTRALEAEDIAVDLETDGLDPNVNEITDISLCFEYGKGVHIEWSVLLESTSVKPGNEGNECFELFKKLMESDIKKVYHNGSFDIKFLRTHGITPKNFYFDTLLAYHTLTMSYEGGTAKGLYKLKNMSWFMTTDGGHDDILTALGGIAGVQGIKKAKAQTKMDVSMSRPKLDFGEPIRTIVRELLPIEEFTDEELKTYDSWVDTLRSKDVEELGLSPKEYYTAMDSDITYRIYKHLSPLIEEKHSWVFHNIIMPLSDALVRIEENGVKLDFDHIDKIAAENEILLKTIEVELIELARDKSGDPTYEFNINSSEQIIVFIKDILKVKLSRNHMTKGGAYAADEKAIKYYAEKHPALAKILSYRLYAKQNSTYLYGYKDQANKKTHRIYPGYQQHSTATGRLSSPIHTVPRENKIRNMIIPAEGCKFVLADLSQVELRILAQLAEDQNMINAFESGMDFHTATACTMFGIDPAEFDKEDKKHNEARSNAKSINFGIVYSMSPKALAEQLKITVEEAERFMNKFFKAYANVRKFIDDSIRFAEVNGYVETLYGRKRFLPMLKSGFKNIRESAKRQATNTRIQGTASDVTALAIIRMQKWLDNNNYKTKIVATIHDSIMLESPFNEVDIASQQLVECMTIDVPRITITLKADLDILDKWVK